ncbi:MAG TPA: cytochrome d ubiquinol oxidase subunit II [Solirubrobacteraceae bacterium]|nr:cytochrome d ubiquinol oxidase subunit II [Solirubrobacteraceae bacterium]
MPDPSFLQTLWFLLIGVLWVGYFVLEGFDFGVGILLRVLGRDQTEKRIIIHTIGPVWDGNEVWLLTAGGATFAAFPGWYASLFSGFYLALFLILAALIIRGVSFEFWGKDDSPRWRATWEWTAVIGSFLAALLWGVGWANIVHGVPMNASHDVTASLWDLLHPYALLGGLVTLSLFLAHGAVFLALRTSGELVTRARAVALRVSLASVALMSGFLVWTALDLDSGGVKVSAQIVAVLAVLAAAAVPAMLSRERDGRAFALSAGAIALLFVSLFVELFPAALASTTNSAYSLSLVAASSNHYTQVVMTIVAIIFVPIVLAYTGWTYWVFRHRLGRSDFEGTPTPLAVIESRLQGGGAGGNGAGGPGSGDPDGSDGARGERPGRPGELPASGPSGSAA